MRKFDNIMNFYLNKFKKSFLLSDDAKNLRLAISEFEIEKMTSSFKKLIFDNSEEFILRKNLNFRKFCNLVTAKIFKLKKFLSEFQFFIDAVETIFRIYFIIEMQNLWFKKHQKNFIKVYK